MLTFILGLAALLPGCFSECITPAQLSHVMYMEADNDDDGVLHLLEMIDVFKAYDANHDGRVTRSEYATYQTRHDPELEDLAHALFNVYDVNDDHHLVMDDYVAFYRSMDSDGDDSVSEREFRESMTKLLHGLRHHSSRICD